MESFFLSYLTSKIHVIHHGKGPELLICFHGFGESAKHFDVIAKGLGDVFTVVAIDLPLHGNTVWREERPLEKADVIDWIEKILAQFGQQTFSLMGYSMGGRVSLCVIEKLATKVNRLILVAPDGLKNNPWHMIATQTRWGNHIFKYNTYHPAFFFRLLTVLRKWHMINESVYKFVLYNMNNLAKRELVYKVWTCLRHMMPNRKHCKQLLAQRKIQTLLFFGKYDRVIPPILGQKFADGTFPCKIVVLDKGHQLLSEELALMVKQNL
ncbi:pimeloyl-ACP methyl ester carboxylesterase [Chitinophaga skermanii]|uniref:Pimeloyl-ACP methyl ester carboxylesterase n=1 Tax=Chitinophaga skermanii TaxID=331697 RepID=A0A327R403_9BACT|nr:alpha/beta hydrolase [Chitinophaga skermanii]RAJ10463.1 pimeloyl-ACP methyl ester carboxylesterase [Chitinophaga skermanii]